MGVCWYLGFSILGSQILTASLPRRPPPLVPPAPPFRVQLYQKALSVKSAIPHPRIMGIVRECGGKMHMSDQLWSEAATDFFEV